MALVLSNRVQESATANTTVSFTLTGAVPGFQTFATIGNTNTTYYSATDAGGNWEVGLGTYSTTGPTLTRTTVYESSNSGSAVTFSGAVSVFVTYPSGRSVNLDASGNVSALGTVSSGTWQGSTVGVAYGGTGVTASTGPNSVVLRDADGNVKGINNVEVGLTLTTSAGATTTLTSASTQIQVLTGTLNQTYKLPDATTLQAGAFYTFGNSSSGVLTVTDNAGATIETITQGGAAQVLCLSAATVGGTWGFRAFASSNTTWGNAILDYSGVITSAEWNGDTVAPAYGGTGLTTFAGANNALYSTGASTLTAGTLPVAAGGTGLTTYTLNGVVYASGTGTLATGSALTFDGTNLINSGAYTAPSNGAGAGTKTTIRGSTGTGQAGASGGNGFIELIGGGGTSTWTTFPGISVRRRGGIYLQAGTAQADAGGTYVNGSTINIIGSTGTNNGTLVGAGSTVLVQAGATTKLDGRTNTGSSVNLLFSSSTVAGSVSIASGIFNSTAGSNNDSFIVLTGPTATVASSVRLAPGRANISGSTDGKAYVADPVTNTDYEILTTNNVTSAAFVNGTANGVSFLNASKVLTTGSALTFDGTNLTIGANNQVGARLTVIANGAMATFNTGAAADGRVEYAYNGTNIFYTGVNSASLMMLMARSGVELGFGANNTEQMRLTSTGLGIGTSSPGAKLDVNGGANSEMRVTTSGSGFLQVGQFTNGAFIGTSSTDATAGILRLGTGGTTRATIDAPGNLGLGVTPSAWGSAFKATDIGTSGTSLASSTNAGYMATVAFNNNSNWIYRSSTSRPTLYTQFDSSHQFYTAPSGTAGNAISFTQALTLHASGGLSLGNTADYGSGNLSVTGKAKIITSATINSSTATTVTNQASGAVLLRDNTNGGTSLIITDTTGGLVIVSQVGATTYVTTSPAATEIQVTNNSGNIQCLGGSSRNGASILTTALQLS